MSPQRRVPRRTPIVRMNESDHDESSEIVRTARVPWTLPRDLHRTRLTALSNTQRNYQRKARARISLSLSLSLSLGRDAWADSDCGGWCAIALRARVRRTHRGFVSEPSHPFSKHQRTLFRLLTRRASAPRIGSYTSSVANGSDLREWIKNVSRKPHEWASRTRALGAISRHPPQSQSGRALSARDGREDSRDATTRRKVRLSGGIFFTHSLTTTTTTTTTETLCALSLSLARSLALKRERERERERVLWRCIGERRSRGLVRGVSRFASSRSHSACPRRRVPRFQSLRGRFPDADVSFRLVSLDTGLRRLFPNTSQIATLSRAQRPASPRAPNPTRIHFTRTAVGRRAPRTPIASARCDLPTTGTRCAFRSHHKGRSQEPICSHHPHHSPV